MPNTVQCAWAKRLQHVLQGIIVTELHPRAAIEIVVQEMGNAGSIFVRPAPVSSSCSGGAALNTRARAHTHTVRAIAVATRASGLCSAVLSVSLA